MAYLYRVSGNANKHIVGYAYAKLIIINNITFISITISTAYSIGLFMLAKPGVRVLKSFLLP